MTSVTMSWTRTGWTFEYEGMVEVEDWLMSQVRVTTEETRTVCAVAMAHAAAKLYRKQFIDDTRSDDTRRVVLTLNVDVVRGTALVAREVWS